MAEIIDGKQGAASVIEMVKAATALEHRSGVQTGLAVIIVGDDPASHAYVSSKSCMAKECGFKSVQHTLPVETKQGELAALVAALNDVPADGRERHTHGADLSGPPSLAEQVGTADDDGVEVSLKGKGIIEDTGGDFRTANAGRAGRALRLNPENGLYLELE